MKDLDLETINVLGYFRLEVGLVPNSWATTRMEELTITPDDYRGPLTLWWLESEPAIDPCKFCDSQWSRVEPTGRYLHDDLHQTSWSDDNHFVEVVRRTNGRLTDFTFSIDIRYQYSEFVDHVIELARVTDCVFFDFRSARLIRPSRQWIVKNIQEHEMSSITVDSSGKLLLN